MPRLGRTSRCSISGRDTPRSAAAWVMAEARGWDAVCSSAAAQASRSFSLHWASKRTSSVTCACPVVSVPVLSTTRVSTLANCSKTRPPLMSRPRRAPAPTAATTESGVARPTAQGQAATNTATAASRWWLKSRVSPARVNTHGRKMAEKRSANFWTGDFCVSASSTRWMMRPSAVCMPMRWTVTSR